MKVIWICNIMLPAAAAYLGRQPSHKEGWLTGLADALKGREADLELAVAFPVERKSDGFRKVIGGMTCYGFYEDTGRPEAEDEGLTERIGRILREYEPDVVHCFGTEYAHTLAAAKAWRPERVLVGLQGVCAAIAGAYLSDLPDRVVKRVTLRDFLRRDSLKRQAEKFGRRAAREKEILKRAGHVAGRTSMDRFYALTDNPGIRYHHMDETLRAEFYEGRWKRAGCEPHSIFVCQGDYPVKGLHYMLHAMPDILGKYPDARLYVGGNSIVNWRTAKDKLKISSYGKYLRELTARYRLEGKVVFLGKMDAGQVKERLLKSHLFACVSTMENSPNSLGEAMLLGVPCVASCVGGVPDIFTDGQDGLLYPGYGAGEYRETPDPEREQARRLAETVLDMWNDENRMALFGAAAREHARATHDREKNRGRLMEIYREIAGEASPGGGNFLRGEARAEKT